MPFLMNTDVRAKKAAKELQKVIAEHGIVQSLTQCREIIAKMYAYENWAALKARLGEGISLDDAKVDQATRKERHVHQESVLQNAGLSAAAAAVVRSRLSITGRKEADAAAVPVITIYRTNQYHTDRLFSAADSMQRTVEDMESRDLGWEHFDIGLYNPFAEIVRHFAKQNGSTPLDLAMIDAEAYDLLWWAAKNSVKDTGYIIDASGPIEDHVNENNLDLPYDGTYSDTDTTTDIYVHLGTNAFPSPYPGCGIEGVYLHISSGPNNDGNDKYLNLDAAFVVSPDIPPDLDTYEFEKTPMHNYLIASRAVHCHFSVESIKETKTLRHIITDPENYFRPADPDQWRPYLAAPLAAAWRARELDAAGIGVIEGIPCDTDDSLERRLQRARTAKQRKKIMSEIIEYDTHLVRFVRGIPDVVKSNDFNYKPGPAKFPMPPLKNPEEWANAYAKLAQSDDIAAGKLYFAELASKIVLAECIHAVPLKDPLLSALVLALKSKSDALCDLKRHDEALDAAITARNLDPSNPAMAFRLVALNVSLGEETAAKEALADISSDDMRLWANALIAARFDPENAAIPIDAAKKRSPNVLSHLNDKFDQAYFRWLEPNEESDYDLLLTGLQWDAWRAVPGYKNILKTA